MLDDAEWPLLEDLARSPAKSLNAASALSAFEAGVERAWGMDSDSTGPLPPDVSLSRAWAGWITTRRPEIAALRALRRG